MGLQNLEKHQTGNVSGQTFRNEGRKSTDSLREEEEAIEYIQDGVNNAYRLWNIIARIPSLRTEDNKE